MGNVFAAVCGTDCLMHVVCVALGTNPSLAALASNICLSFVCSFPHVFSSFLPCLPVQLDARATERFFDGTAFSLRSMATSLSNFLWVSTFALRTAQCKSCAYDVAIFVTQKAKKYKFPAAKQGFKGVFARKPLEPFHDLPCPSFTSRCVQHFSTVLAATHDCPELIRKMLRQRTSTLDPEIINSRPGAGCG